MVKEAIVLFSITGQNEEREYWPLWLKLLLAYTQEFPEELGCFLVWNSPCCTSASYIRSLAADPKLLNQRLPVNYRCVIKHPKYSD